MKRFVFICISLIAGFNSIVRAGENPQDKMKNKKDSFYFYWGYNRGYYSKSNIHFNGANYDFTVYKVKATDRPTKFSAAYFTPGGFSIPQYNYRFGYFFSDRLSISGGNDHMKYVMTNNQEVRMSGVITKEASEKYAGNYLNKTIKLDPDLLTFEHTNGFNLVSIDFEYLLPVKSFFNDKVSVLWNSGLGGIWVVTKTDVRVMGDGLDNDFHIAGWTLGGKTGPRVEYKHKVFLLAEIKSGYVSLPSVLIKNADPEIGDHNLLYLEYYIGVGMNFRLKRKNAV